MKSGVIYALAAATLFGASTPGEVGAVLRSFLLPCISKESQRDSGGHWNLPHQLALKRPKRPAVLFQISGSEMPSAGGTSLID